MVIFIPQMNIQNAVIRRTIKWYNYAKAATDTSMSSILTGIASGVHAE